MAAREWVDIIPNALNLITHEEFFGNVAKGFRVRNTTALDFGFKRV